MNLLPGRGSSSALYPGDRGFPGIPEPAVVFDIPPWIPEGIFGFISSATRDFIGFRGGYPRISGSESDSIRCGRSW